MYLDRGQTDFTTKLNRTATTYKKGYSYFRDFLFEFCMKLFTFENLPDTIPEKEVLTRLYLHGTCGIVKNKDNKLIAVTPCLYGVTDYYDEFTNFTWATPKNNGDAVINKTGVLIDANELRNELYHKIHHYAILMAHADVTLLHELVNGRSNMAITAISERFANLAKSVRQKQYNGELDVYVDNGFSTLKFEDMKSDKTASYMNALEVRDRLFDLFCEEIGVKRANSKKERLVVDEANADNTFLLLNITNMYESIQKGVEDMNRLFSTNVNVKCNVDYSTANSQTPTEEQKEGVNE